MRLLLDTHTFFWFLDDSPRLSANAKSLITDGTNDVLLSMASVWEMAIKISLGKLSVAGPFATYIEQHLQANTIGLVEISLRHVDAVATLPFYHRNPFDRLLIAQAHVEDIPIISTDTAFEDYPIVGCGTAEVVTTRQVQGYTGEYPRWRGGSATHTRAPRSSASRRKARRVAGVDRRCQWE